MSSHRTPIAPPRRVLCIDDSELLLDRVRAALEPQGYEVVTTSQTVGAARHLSGCGLVIIDLHMPGFDGTAVLESLRQGLAAHPNANVPLFYLYSSSGAVAADWSKLGFDGVFTRKGDEQALVPQVDAAFRRLKLREIAARRSK